MKTTVETLSSLEWLPPQKVKKKHLRVLFFKWTFHLLWILWIYINSQKVEEMLQYYDHDKMFCISANVVYLLLVLYMCKLSYQPGIAGSFKKIFFVWIKYLLWFRLVRIREFKVFCKRLKVKVETLREGPIYGHCDKIYIHSAIAANRLTLPFYRYHTH